MPQHCCHNIQSSSLSYKIIQNSFFASQSASRNCPASEVSDLTLLCDRNTAPKPSAEVYTPLRTCRTHSTKTQTALPSLCETREMTCRQCQNRPRTASRPHLAQGRYRKVEQIANLQTFYISNHLAGSTERASPRGYAIFIFVRSGGGEDSLRDRRIPSLDVKYYSKIILFCFATFSERRLINLCVFESLC